MPLRVSQVVNSAVQSTREYLSYLERRQGGLARHLAQGIRERNASVLVGNRVSHEYVCRLPRQLRITPESAATLVPKLIPGEEVEIRFRHYNRVTGDAIFVTEHQIECDEGDVVVDFRWIVRRCLEWLEKRGTDVEAPGNLTASVQKIPFESLSELSGEQNEAVQTVLRHVLSYVWGPPGTGKTNKVLAQSAQQCLRNDERILIAAPTNLAVDNALTAILRCGVDRHRVMRIGIPSERFLETYPECCEDRAFQSEIQQLRQQIGFHEAELAHALQVQSRTEALSGLQGEIRILVECLASDERRSVEVASAVNARGVVIETLGESEKDLGRQWQYLQAARRELSLEQIERDIEALEAEHSSTIREKLQIEGQLTGLGFLARYFTGKRQRLESELGNNLRHLCSVEETLGRQRTRHGEVLPMDSDLLNQITAVERELTSRKDELSQLKLLQEADEKTARELKVSISTLRDGILSHREKAKETQRWLEMSVSRGALTQGGLERIQKQIEELRKQIEKYTQSLATKSVLGMTLDGFIGMSFNGGIDIDRVFVDEASYAPLAKVIPLLSLRCPIVLLGDHCQLPPVIEGNPNHKAYSFWGKSAIFLEDVFQCGDNHKELAERAHPQRPFGWSGLPILSRSFRFGDEMAALLDRHIYNIGLRGNGHADSVLRCFHCEPSERSNRLRRQNYSEAETILSALRRWWSSFGDRATPPTIAVLTPYRHQAKLLRERLGQVFCDHPILNHVEVLNVHQAQGREWDWVLFSVSDTRRLKLNSPFFTDTTNADGRALVNTTISRAKQHLRIFFDAAYWRGHNYSLLTELARGDNVRAWRFNTLGVESF